MTKKKRIEEGREKGREGGRIERRNKGNLDNEQNRCSSALEIKNCQRDD